MAISAVSDTARSVCLCAGMLGCERVCDRFKFWRFVQFFLAQVNLRDLEGK